MKYSFLILVLSLSLSACNTKPEIPDNQLQTQSSSSIEQQADTPKTGTLKLSKDTQSVAYYEGTIIVSGTYGESHPGTLMGGILCFHADESTGYLIPRDPNMWGPGNRDTRTPWFCFDNQEAAKKLFKINDEEVFNNIVIDDPYATCDISGKATIQVTDYKVDKREIMTYDTARLTTIISKEPFTLDCD